MTDQTSDVDPTTEAVAPPSPVAAVAVAKYNTKAVIGLILSIVSVLLILVPFVNWLVAVPGIVLGVLGRNEIAATGERSREVALAAIVIGAISTAISLLILIGIGVAADRASQQLTPGGDSDACVSRTGDFTQQQLQDCFDSEH